MRLSLLLPPLAAAAAASLALTAGASPTPGGQLQADAAVTVAAAEFNQLLALASPLLGHATLDNTSSAADVVGGSRRLAVRQLGEGGPEGWTCSPAASAADDGRPAWACIDPASLDPATCVLSVRPDDPSSRSYVAQLLTCCRLV
jgi:hypothetical protein